METMVWGKRRDRRSYTPKFESEIVDRCRAGDRSIAEVARDLDLTPSAVRRWVAQAEIDAGERRGLRTDERDELSRLRRENERLQADVDLLERATAFFAFMYIERGGRRAPQLVELRWLEWGFAGSAVSDPLVPPVGATIRS